MENIPRIQKLPRSRVIIGEEMREKEEDNNLVQNLQELLNAQETPPYDQVIPTAYEHIYNTVDEKDRPRLIIAHGRKMGNECYTNGLYKDAIDFYRGAIKMLPHGRDGFLSSKFFNSTYMTLFSKPVAKNWILLMDLMACCNNIAQCYLKLNDISSAVDWLQELEVIYECYQVSTFQFDGQADSTVLEHCTYRMKAALRFIHISRNLGNSAAVTYYSYLSSVHYSAIFPESIPQLKKLIDECDIRMWYAAQHPSVHSAKNWDVTEPKLQVRGIWRRLNMKADYRPLRRMQDGCWIWKSRLYMFGGLVSSDYGRDLWYWDLKEGKEWVRLPDIPLHCMIYVRYCQSPVVYERVVIFFCGFKELVLFDLDEEKWAYTPTTFRGKWPYEEHLQNASVDMYMFHLFVFGGQVHGGANNSVLMVLDMRTLEWRLLGKGGGNNFEEKYNVDWPGSRGSAAYWMDFHRQRFCIMYGSLMENRLMRGAPDDLWSYSILEKKWTRERIRGNFPPPRFFTSAVYHRGLKSVLMHGGLGSTCCVVHSPQPMREEERFKYTLNGDVYIMDTQTGIWRQIVTRGFPTWRSQGHLLVDNDTGKIYLFGGSSITDMTQKEDTAGPKTHCFQDLWELELDLPGQQFDEKAFLEGIPFWRAGLWRQCYNCGAAGKTFYRCGGSCRGKYIFCSVMCQKSAWKKHAEEHGCRKIIIRNL